MKLKPFLFSLILIQIANAQNVSFSPKFISFRNATISPSLGGQLNFPTADLGKKPDGYKIIGGGGVSIGLGFDFYSPNSIMGLYVEGYYGFISFGIKNTESKIDSFDVSFINVPAFLKIRLGAKNSEKHFWLAFGASINFPLTCKRRLFDGDNMLNENKGKDQLVSKFRALNFIFAREGFRSEDQSGIRAIFFIASEYKLDNILNSTSSNLAEGNPAQNYYRSVGKYDEIDFRNLIITIGLKFLYRIQAKSN